MPHRVYKFVDLQLFDVKFKFVHLHLFDVKLLFSEKHIIRKQKRTAVYGRASLVSYFKLPREKWWPVTFETHIHFEALYPVHEYTKMRIPDKMYQTNTVRTIWGTWTASTLRYLGVNHIGKSRTKICGKQEKL